MVTRRPVQAEAIPLDPAAPLRIYLFLTLAMVFWGGTFVVGRFLSSQVEAARISRSFGA